MRATCLFLALAATLALPMPAAAQIPSPEYATLLASLKAGHTDVDYTRLRLSYIDSPEYKAARDTSESEKAMWGALGEKDYARALKQAETVLAGEYVNIDAHFVAYAADKELGAADQAEFHLTVFRSLLNSIRNSGDGKSTKSAWVVISVHEEYELLRVLGFQVTGQALLNQNGHSYDEMKVKSTQDGSEQTFYFNVDIPIKHEF